MIHTPSFQAKLLSLALATLTGLAAAAPLSEDDAVSIETARAPLYRHHCPDESNFRQGVCVLTSIAPSTNGGYFIIKKTDGLIETYQGDIYGNSSRGLKPGDYVLYAYGLVFEGAGQPFTVEPGRITRVKTATLVTLAPRDWWLDVQSGPDVWVSVPTGTQCSEPSHWDSIQGLTAYAYPAGSYTIDFGGEPGFNGDPACNALEFEVELEAGTLTRAKWGKLVE